VRVEPKTIGIAGKAHKPWATRSMPFEGALKKAELRK